MGVSGLQTIIDVFGADSIKNYQLQHYRGTFQALDGSVTIYKSCMAILNSENFISADGKFVGHLFACFFKSMTMLKYGIMPIWVFDGSPPAIKRTELTKRKKLRENAISKLYNNNLNINEINKLHKKAFNITTEHIREIKHLLTLMGLPYVESPGEAEAQCAALNIANISHGVVTEDWDAILFGCHKMLKDFSNKSPVIEIDIKKLMNSLQMDRDQLINLSAILGNDYCSGIGGLKPIDAYIKFKVCNFNMNRLISDLKNEKKYHIPVNFEEQLKACKDYYLHAPVIDPHSIEIIWTKPNYLELNLYLIKEKQFSPELINSKVNDLYIMYDRYITEGELVTMSKIRNERTNKVFNINYKNTGSFTEIMSVLSVSNLIIA